MDIWRTELLSLAAIAALMGSTYLAFAQLAPRPAGDEPQLAPYSAPADVRR